MSTPFDPICGNEKLKVYLSKLVEKNTVPQSLLFSGPEGIGKSRFAAAFAKMIIDTQKNVHPDIHHFQPEGKIGMHSIQTMREFTESVYLAPYQAKKKVFIIHDAHRMLTYSANALLKTFEEPALDSVIILLTHVPEQLLPTVLSRCQTIRFLPIPKDAIINFLMNEKKISSEIAERMASRAGGSVGKALQNGEQGQHPLRELLLNILSQGELDFYPNIVQYSKEFSDQIETQLQNEEALLQEQLFAAFKEKPSAQQKQMLEKEIEGAVSVKKTSEAKYLFDVLLSWYRDLHLLLVSGNTTLLMNPDYHTKLLQILQRGGIHPIEKVEKAVSRALLALERSTSLNLCFENLFLTLAR
jgi:DNA polymerase-3 subunit delta'